jgi:hypothetical protein
MNTTQQSQSQSSSRPANLNLDEVMNPTKNTENKKEPMSPNIRIESPIYCPSPNAEKGSRTYYKSGTPRSPDGSPSYTLPTHSPRQEQEITITDAIHISRWAIGYVLGGRSNKHLKNVLKSQGNLIEKVGEPVSHKLKSGKIVMVLSLIGTGVHSGVTKAMHNVKRSLIVAIKKAKQMKTNGTWVDNRRNKNNNRNNNNRNSSRSNNDRRNNDRHNNDRHNDRHNERRSYDRYDRHNERRSYDRYDNRNETHYVNDHRDGNYIEEYY